MVDDIDIKLNARIDARKALQQQPSPDEEGAGVTLATEPGASPSSSPTATLSPPSSQRFAGALSFLKLADNVVSRPMNMARQALATTGFNIGGVKMTMKGEGHEKYTYPTLWKRLEDASTGKLRMSSREFNELLISRSTMEALDEFRFAPWAPGFIGMTHTPDGVKPPKGSFGVGSIFDMGTDVGTDPLTYLTFFSSAPLRAASATLRTASGSGLHSAALLGKAATAVDVIENPYRIVTTPLRRWFGPESTHPILPWINLLRHPEAVFVNDAKEIFDNVALATTGAIREISEHALTFQNSIKTAGLEEALLRPENRQALGAWIEDVDLNTILNVPANTPTRAGTQIRLTPEQRSIADVMSREIQARFGELYAAGIVNPADIKHFGTLGDFFTKKIGIGRQMIPRDILQSFDWEKIGSMNPMSLMLKSEYPSIVAANAGRVAYENLDGYEAFKYFTYSVARKKNIEPTLLKYAPKRDAALEHAVTKKLSPVQRRYLISWTNEFTGHGRGRTALMMDAAVGEAWEKVLKTPLGKRVENFAKVTGTKRNLDGFYDFSPTAKIAAMSTHNIFRNAVSGNLSTSLLNLSQTTYMAAAEGMPQTLRGLARMVDPEFRAIRRDVDLLGDYQMIFNEQNWIKSFGEKADRILFTPFQTAERINRGLAFNIGLDKALRKRGVATMGEAAQRNLPIQHIIDEAHLESAHAGFWYGTLGRAPALANPFLQPGLALTSFPYKTGEYLNGIFQKDGGAFVRFLALHGWLIERSQDWMGISGERQFGWGFVPMSRNFAGLPFAESPPMRTLTALFKAHGAWRAGDMKMRQKYFKEAADNLTNVGLHPLPITEIKNITTLVEEIATKKQKLSNDYHVDVTNQDAVLHYVFGRTARDSERSHLERDKIVAQKLIEVELDRRSRKVAEAFTSTDGNKLRDAGQDLGQPIWVNSVPYYPSGEMYRNRITREVTKRQYSKDLISVMDRTDVLEQLYINAQLQLLQKSPPPR